LLAPVTKENTLEPLVSVVVCAFNEELYIQTCIRSLLNQKTQFRYEIILVNDASTDSTLEIMKNFDYSEITTIISNSSNMGIGYTSNVGIRKSHGRYVVRVDADDYVSEYFLQTLFLAIHDQSNYKAVACDYHLVSANGDTVERKKFVETPIACGIMFEKEALVSIGLYRDNLRVFEEIELMERFRAKYPILDLPISLYRYRIHESNTSRMNVTTKGVN
jgi:glycosyltransferase involved in cell wall biosynthesis